MPSATNDFKKGISSFELVGKLHISPNTFSLDDKSKNGFISNKMYLGVDCGNGGVVFAEMWGGYSTNEDGDIVSKLYVHGSKTDPNDSRRSIDDYDNRFEVSWEDREDPEVVSEVGPSCFIRVGLEVVSDKKLAVHRFLSAYDAVADVNDIISGWTEEQINSTIVTVRGNIEYRYYEGRVTYRKVINSIILNNFAKEEDFKSEFTQTIYVNKTSLGKPDMEKKLLPITAKIPEYVGKYKGYEVKETVPLDVEFQIDCTSKFAKFFAEQIKASNKYMCAVVRGSFSETGSTEIITVEDLPETYRNLIEEGSVTEEDVMKCYASDNRKVYLLYLNGIRVIKDESGLPAKDITLNVYTEKDMDKLSENFYEIVREADSDKEETETVPTPTEDDELPADIEEASDEMPVDDMSWMENFMQ